jgi:hypothetical protein
VTDAEIIERVDAWLRGWTTILARRERTDALIEQWRECSRRWGPMSGSAVGALLALVREAIGDPHATTCRVCRSWSRAGGTEYGWALHSGKGRKIGPFCGSDVESLAIALESEPMNRDTQ